MYDASRDQQELFSTTGSSLRRLLSTTSSLCFIISIHRTLKQDRVLVPSRLTCMEADTKLLLTVLARLLRDWSEPLHFRSTSMHDSPHLGRLASCLETDSELYIYLTRAVLASTSRQLEHSSSPSLKDQTFSHTHHHIEAYPGRMRVLISGAGIAGPTLAWFLARTGTRVTVLEKAYSILPYGQDIDVQGSAITVIKKM